MKKEHENNKLMVIDAKVLKALDKTAREYRDLVVKGDTSPTATVLQAQAMQSIRDLLTPEVMTPIMALQGSRLGFKTDKDIEKAGKSQSGKWIYKKGQGYPVDVVKDVTIWAWAHGAGMVLNQVNIISGNGYLTKEYFIKRIDELLGRDNWMMIHSVPVSKNGGAIVKTTVKWRRKSGQDWESQELELAIKGDSFATTDSYLGKADRKAGAWLLKNITGEVAPDGDVEDNNGAIDITPHSVTDATPEKKEPAKQTFNKALQDKLAGKMKTQMAIERAEKPEPENAPGKTPEDAPGISDAEKNELIKDVIMVLGAPRNVITNFFHSLPADNPFRIGTGGLKELPGEALQVVLAHADEWKSNLQNWADKQ